jgi:hypothetical protein
MTTRYASCHDQDAKKRSHALTKGIFPIKESMVYVASFTHANGTGCTLTVQVNPLTGDWIDTWEQGDTCQANYRDKDGASALLKSVIKKCHDCVIEARQVAL